MPRLLPLLALLCCGSALANGPLGIDHRLNKDDSGIWSTGAQRSLHAAAAVGVVGGALWEGSESRLGRSFWRASEAMLLAAGASTAAKLVFQRERPNVSNDPNAWFSGSRNQSFPSREVAHISAIVTPFILEYGQEQPATWLLAGLPVYAGVARLKSQAHWQTDVLAGAALGVAMGWQAQQRERPWLVSMLPGGLAVSYKSRF